ncbi:ELKS/Rab6-interacting/CAST family member 1-like [Galleria mellonella]|uniref:ELKS/Rab6-interacting/CAST family member 1-like n=1 Tax=Galleria mellonella TaxID=7137 RepID=A0ABM3MZ15_GALME|nr:ELKS/Rab6-interacting/CAST family member 1-like [Galleria mellonella]
MIQYLSESKQKIESELNDTRVKLATTQAQKEESSAAVVELRKQLEQVKQELNMKDVSLVQLQKDTKQLLNEFSTQSNEMKSAYTKKEEHLKEALEEIEALKRALNNQEAFTESVRKQNEQLQEQLAAVEERYAANARHTDQLQRKLEEAEVTIANNNDEILKMQDKIEKVEKEVDDKHAVIIMKENEINNLQIQLNNIETEKVELLSKLESSAAKNNAEEARVAELSASIELLHTNLQTHKDASDARIAELIEAIESKDKELDSKAGTIAQLMCEVTGAVDTSARLETALHKLRKEMEIEKDSWREKDRKHAQQVERLEVLLREKEEESSKQMSIILEIRAEKERLQEKFQNMQATMDNIQKQLSRPLVPPKPREAPEHDDNARPFATQLAVTTPQNINKPMNTRKLAGVEAGHGGKVNQEIDSIVFSLFSDNSTDDCANKPDPPEATRRFEAPYRGNSAPATFKRRTGVPAARPRVYVPDDDDDNALISLSQTRNNLKNKEQRPTNQRAFFKSKRETKRPK